jgi:hypothetical protein
MARFAPGTSRPFKSPSVSRNVLHQQHGAPRAVVVMDHDLKAAYENAIGHPTSNLPGAVIATSEQQSGPSGTA